MVLDQGQIAELDTPTTLLQNNKSIFFSMAKDAGLVRDQVIGDEVDADQSEEGDIGPAGAQEDDDTQNESSA